MLFILHLLLSFLIKRFSGLDRAYLIERLSLTWRWFASMSVVAVAILVVMGGALSLCEHSTFIHGAVIGLLCATPLLLFLWVPFLAVAYFLELTEPLKCAWLFVAEETKLPSCSFFCPACFSASSSLTTSVLPR